MDAGEQIAAVEGERRGPPAGLTGLVEVGGIALNPLAAHPDVLFASAHQRLAAQLRAEETQRLPQCPAGMLRVELGPEEAHQGVPPAESVITREREVDQQGESLRLHQHGPQLAASVRVDEIHAAEQPELNHGAWGKEITAGSRLANGRVTGGW